MIKQSILIIVGMLCAIKALAQPDWSFERNQYSESMTIVLAMEFDTTWSNDENDRIAAFINGEIRGLAYSQLGNSGVYLCFLQVFSNTLSGDTINFQLYDASENELLDAYNKLVFYADELIGTNSDPIIISNTPPIARNITFLDADKFFSPNGDGVNDQWVIRNIDELIGNEISIYNTSGEEVYNANPYQNDWNGIYKGKDLPADVYIYLLKIPDTGQQFKGIISLVR